MDNKVWCIFFSAVFKLLIFDRIFSAFLNSFIASLYFFDRKELVSFCMKQIEKCIFHLKMNASDIILILNCRIHTNQYAEAETAKYSVSSHLALALFGL